MIKNVFYLNLEKKVIDQDISTINSVVFINYVRDYLGKNFVKEIFKGIFKEDKLISDEYFFDNFKTGKVEPLDLSFFLNPDYFYSNEINLILFKNMTKLNINLFDVGIYGARNSKKLQTKKIVLLAYLSGPKNTIKRANEFNKMFNKTKYLSLENVTKSGGIIKLNYYPGYEVIKEICEYNRGWYVGLLEVVGFKGIEINETSCVVHGDNCCTLKVNWDSDNLTFYSKFVKIKDEFILSFFARTFKNEILKKLSAQEDLVNILRAENQKSFALIENLEKKNRDLRKSHEIVEKFVASEVLSELKLNNKNPLLFVPEKVNAVILFSDMRDFTNLSEGLDNEYLVAFLNEYYGLTISIYKKYGGIVDKIMGDGIMVIFSNVDNALKASIEVINEIKIFNKRLEIERELRIGIGLTYGEIIKCNLGYIEHKLDRTFIGDIVNQASRIENLNKTYDSQILLSGDFYNRLKDKSLIRYMDEILVKGKKRKIHLYEYFGCQDIDVKRFKLEYYNNLIRAISKFQDGNKFSAKNEFLFLKECASKLEIEDKLIDIYLSKLQ
ncbi:MAG: adenylate/guanylate cyclase domain-containing protein [Nanoarchaeota archaeon]|nr:adenylate/guanylate cyclase domain-containing protein [Nanoarchaeota archaeon]